MLGSLESRVKWELAAGYPSLQVTTDWKSDSVHPLINILTRAQRNFVRAKKEVGLWEPGLYVAWYWRNRPSGL